MSNKVELLKNGIKEKLEKIQVEHKMGVDKSEGSADGFILILGICFILAYIIVYNLSKDPEFLPNKHEALKSLESITQLIMIAGITFCVNSIYSIFKRWRIIKNDVLIYENVNQQLEKTFEQTEYINWLSGIEDDGITAIMNSGLVNVHKSRQELYEKTIKIYFEKNKDVECDIICYDGMEDFTGKFSTDCLCNYLNKGLQLKILSANPNVSHWTQHEIDMSINLNDEREYNIDPLDYTCKSTTKKLNEWYIVIANQLSNDEKDKIQLKFYNSLPSLYLFRMDNRLFISGKLIGNTDVSNPPIFEYIDTQSGNDIFDHYKRYFDLMWNDPDLATGEQELLINPKLLIGNKVVNLILFNACNAMTEILRAACPKEYTEDDSYPLKSGKGIDPIRAFFTVLDYGKPYKSSRERRITRRYNTNGATRQNPNLAVDHCNGSIDSLKEGYPITCSHAIGRAMVEGKGVFRTTVPQKEPQEPDKKSRASLVLPLKFSEKSKNETIIDFVYEGTITKSNIDIPETAKVNGHDVNNYASTPTQVFATVAFEFDDNVRHIIVSDETKDVECNIITYNYENGFKSQLGEYPFDTKQVNRRLIEEAERCQKLLLEYFGFKSEAVKDAEALKDGKLDS